MREYKDNTTWKTGRVWNDHAILILGGLYKNTNKIYNNIDVYIRLERQV